LIKKIYCEICKKETDHEIIKDEFDDEEKICIKCGLWTSIEEEDDG
jgi:uncharacterized Zn finger protein